MKITLLLIVVLFCPGSAFAVCTEFNKSRCDDESICQEEWGIYSERYQNCLEQKRLELEKLRQDVYEPADSSEGQNVVVAGQNNVINIVNQTNQQ